MLQTTKIDLFVFTHWPYLTSPLKKFDTDLMNEVYSNIEILLYLLTHPCKALADSHSQVTANFSNTQTNHLHNRLYCPS